MNNDTIDLLTEAGFKTPGQEPAVKEPAAPAPENKEQTNTQDTPARKAATAEPAKPVQQEQQKWNIDEELVKITEGKVKNPAELAAILEKYGTISDFESKIAQFENENTELKAKVNTDPFANELSKKFNELLKGGAKPEQVDAFLKLNKHDNFESMSPYDVKLLALQVKEGLTEKEAKEYIDDEYKLNPDEHDESTIAKGQIRLKLHSNADREFLNGYKAKVSTAPVSQREVQEAAAQEQHVKHVNTLAPIAKDVLKGISFTNQNINGKADDKAIFADFTPSEESLKSLPEKVAQFINGEGANIPANAEGAQRINDFAESVLILQNHKTWQQHAVNVAEKKIREEYHNPSAINRGSDNDKNAGNSDKEARIKFVTDFHKL